MRPISLPPPGKAARISSADRAYKKELQLLGFFGLPPEVRLVIYQYCLVPKGKPTLRNPELVPTRHPCHIQLCDNAILRVCRMIYEEAIPVFFASNTFHHSLRCKTIGLSPISSDTLFMRNLQHLRHVSLDVWAGCWSEDFNPAANRLLSKFLDGVRGQCGESIRSLEIQLVSLASDHSRSVPLLGEGITTLAIQKLRPHLQSLTVVGYSSSWPHSSNVLEEFCLAIAPDEFWDKRRCRNWPGVSLPLAIDFRVHHHLEGGTPRSPTPESPEYVDRWQIRWTTNRDTLAEA